MNDVKTQGLDTWVVAHSNSTAFDEYAWLWFGKIKEANFSKVILAYGESDKFKNAADLMAYHLHDEHVMKNSGKHDWETWAALWKQMLADKNFWKMFES